jgi:hypothetical protein
VGVPVVAEVVVVGVVVPPVVVPDALAFV